MSMFTKEELLVIAENNKGDLGDITPLSDYELICLKTGENIHLGIITRAKAILAINRPLSPKDFVTRSELSLLLEEHTNLAAKTMLMFMALERRGLISEKEIFDIADELKMAHTGGQNESGKDEARPRKRAVRKRKEATAPEEDERTARISVPRKRRTVRVRLRPKKG